MTQKPSGRQPTLTYDRGTLILHPPPQGKRWLDYATWDDRIEKFRVPARYYRQLTEASHAEGAAIVDRAGVFEALALTPAPAPDPYSHQTEALAAWQEHERRGVVVLPTGAGKTFLAQLAIEQVARSTLIVVPTLDLMHQWYATLEAAYPDTIIGLLGGGSKDNTPLLIATYDSAAIFAETLGNRYSLLVFDECHHLPGEFARSVAEYSLAPYRLGLSATPERSDERHHDLDGLIGPVVYRRAPADLAGGALSRHRIEQIKVQLTDEERERYDALIEQRNAFLRGQNIFLGSLRGWQDFVRASARSRAGRAAMLAHREARSLAFGTEAKLRVLEDLLHRHDRDRVLVFTDDNRTVYRISQELLVPAITHQTPVKERHAVLGAFRNGDYPRIVSSKVLNEGVDVPEANVAIVLSGSGSTREYVQRLGRILRRGEGKLAVLYEVIAEGTSEEGVSQRRRSTGRDQDGSVPRQGTLPAQRTLPRQRTLGLERIAEGDALDFDEL